MIESSRTIASGHDKRGMIVRTIGICYPRLQFLVANYKPQWQIIVSRLFSGRQVIIRRHRQEVTQ